MAFVRNLVVSSSHLRLGTSSLLGFGKKNTIGLSKSIRGARCGSTYPIDDVIFGLTDDQKQVRQFCLGSTHLQFVNCKVKAFVNAFDFS